MYPAFSEINRILRGSPWFPIPEPAPVHGDYSSGLNLIKEAPYKQFSPAGKRRQRKRFETYKISLLFEGGGSYKKDGNKGTIRAWKMFWLEGNKEKALRLTAKNLHSSTNLNEFISPGYQEGSSDKPVFSTYPSKNLGRKQLSPLWFWPIELKLNKGIVLSY